MSSLSDLEKKPLSELNSYELTYLQNNPFSNISKMRRDEQRRLEAEEKARLKEAERAAARDSNVYSDYFSSYSYSSSSSSCYKPSMPPETKEQKLAREQVERKVKERVDTKNCVLSVFFTLLLSPVAVVISFIPLLPLIAVLIYGISSLSGYEFSISSTKSKISLIITFIILSICVIIGQLAFIDICMSM